MSTDDHRTPRGADRRRARRRGARGLPAARAWPAHGRRCARRSGSRIAPPSGSGYALTFDDGPHAAGDARGARDAAPARACGRPSSSSASRSGATPALAREIVAAGPRRRPALRPPPQPAAAGARGRCARTSRAPRRRSRRPPASSRRCIARPTACSTRPRCGSRGRAAGARCCGANGAATGRRGRHPRRSPSCVTRGAGEGSVLLLHDADDYSAPGSWRRTVGGAAARARDARARRGLEPVAP